MPKGSGRRPLPTAVKKLRGNPGRRPLNRAEPKPTKGPPAKPAQLTGVASEEWDAIVPQLELLGVLTVVDGKALAAYCHFFARWWQAEAEIERLGIILEEERLDKEGNLVGAVYKRNPAISVSHEAAKIMRSYLVEFGMTPSSRSRLRMTGEQERDPFDEFLSNKNVTHNARVN
jgi:P27 family predicted phage terminase small subunit